MTPRLAVFADIHGNLPALEAALAEIEGEAVDQILVAGDMVAGPNPQAVIDRLRELGSVMLRGNNENYILRFLSGEAPAWWHTSQQWAFTHWNYRQLDAETPEFIRALPEQRVIHLPGTDPIRVVHGSPRNNAELVYPDKDISLLDLALSQTTEPVLIFGHTHVSWQLRRAGRLAFNPGALCGQFNGQVCGGYALLSWEGGQWQVEQRELHYDLELLRQAFRETGLLEAGGAVARYYLRDLETGTNSLPRFIEFAWEQTRQAGLTDAAYVPDQIWEQADRLFASELAQGNISL